MQTEEQNRDEFETDDLFLASFLLTKGVKLIGLKNNGTNHFSFTLSDSSKCEELRREFLNNEPAPAQELFAKREMLINEIKGQGKV